jgi:hypothetical protein
MGALALTVASMAGIGSIAAQPAQAASTISINVYVTTTQCPQGGTVKRVNASITDPGLNGSVGSSSGNTVNGLKTFSGYRSLIQGSNFCQTKWYGAGYYWYWSVYRYLYSNGQTTYI